MKHIIESNPHLQMVTEFFPSALRGCGTDPAEFLHDLVQHGFELFKIDEQEHQLAPADISQLVKDDIETNLLCTRTR